MSETFDWLGAEPTTYKFYGNTVTIFYDDAEHSYTRYEDDKLVRIPGVTTVVGVYDKSAALCQWASNQCSEYIEKQCHEFSTADATTVLTWLDKARFAYRDYKDAAADTGHLAHGWIENYIKAQIAGKEFSEPLPTDERAANGCRAALEWMEHHKVRWVFTERKIYSNEHDYAGTCDGLAYISSCGDPVCCGAWNKVDDRWSRVALEFTDALAIVDWKTSNSLHEAYAWQVSAYQKAIEAEIGLHGVAPELSQEIEYRVLCRLGKDDAKFEARLLMPESLDKDYQIFLDCLSLYRDVKSQEEEDKQRRREIRQQDKEDREEALKIKCKGADRYKGVRAPQCNGGEPCQTCLQIYAARQAEKGKVA